MQADHVILVSQLHTAVSSEGAGQLPSRLLSGCWPAVGAFACQETNFVLLRAALVHRLYEVLSDRFMHKVRRDKGWHVNLAPCSMHLNSWGGDRFDSYLNGC